ncbi:MAG TPA: iron transporter [Sulfurovum sp. UBA12169]|nr:MAG TPA: iron transporter [Sulfurovum sp. UBA12169]
MLLSQLHKGDRAQIVKINANKILKDRFVSFGIIPGETLAVKTCSMAKQTMEIEIEGTHIALRAVEANKIEIIKL